MKTCWYCDYFFTLFVSTCIFGLSWYEGVPLCGFVVAHAVTVRWLMVTHDKNFLARVGGA